MIPAWWLFIPIGIAVILICALEAYHAEERREMLDRLMSRDLADFKLARNGQTTPKGRNWLRTAMERVSRIPKDEA